MRADKKGIPAMFEDVLRKINTKPKQLDNIDEWLFVTVNTMKAIIDNSCKEDVSLVLKARDCHTTSELQKMYDSIQGRYGRDGFSYRNSPEYYYLSSLVARCPETELTDKNREKIAVYYDTTEYLLYRI